MGVSVNRKRIVILGAGVLLGLAGGFLYWKLVGCQSGTCSITANWHTSTLFGGVFGFLLADSIKTTGRKKEEKVEKAD